MRLRLFCVITALAATSLHSQEKDISKFNSEYLNWYNKDYSMHQVLGASIDKTYDSVLCYKKPLKTIIVAVIDAGVDIHHADLEGKIWVNINEIPENLIDDDNNGYVDDVNGWNFIGHKSGQNVKYENYEFTRVIKQNNDSNIYFTKARDLYNEKILKKNDEKTNIKAFEEKYVHYKSIVLTSTGIDVKSKEDAKKIKPNNSIVAEAKHFLEIIYSNGFSDEALQSFIKENEESFQYHLNKEYNAREIVGDNPYDINDKDYGNNDVIGPMSDHGTSVAGVIAAIRDNNVGIDGIASNVLIMPIRVVPNGDERDKDVALAIKYAVDNGADIINMSFGKQISPQKGFVDEAIRYAEKNDVLMVHGAGNYGYNVDYIENYPSKKYADHTEATNWLNVGSTKKVLNKQVLAEFSDYGQKYVDLFAPGVDIVSLDTNNTYSMNSGTSLSAPIVTGIASVLLSYYPELKPQEIIDVLLRASFKISKPKRVFKPGLSPGRKEKVPFYTLSKSGGIVNLYDAMILLENKRK